MKKGDRFRNKATRRIVYYKAKYKENISGKIVINYTHPKAPSEVGAMYKDEFLKFYHPVS